MTGRRQTHVEGYMLRIEVRTDVTGDEEAYIHDIQPTEDKKMTSAMIEALLAVETLYGHEGVNSIYIYAAEVE
jgi:hypothetical protein